MNDDLYDLGTMTRRDVLGDEVDSAVLATNGFTRDFERDMTRREWGDLWSRPGLDRRTRISITLAMLVIQGLEEELAVYVRAAIRNGVTLDEIMEIINQAGMYAGAPVARRAFAVASAAVRDIPEADERSTSDI
jgi:alkylhydroperoxidase/carboxymuconolactone decarboxylase family protein YurZ